MSFNEQFCSLRLLIPLLLVLSASYRLYDEIVSTRDLIISEPYQQFEQPIRHPANSKKCQPAQYDSHHSNYTVPFIHPTQWMKGEGDIYSGMWWQSIDSMLKINYSTLGFLEGISFRSFEKNERVIQTVDWLDMAVEHLSKYVKFFSGIQYRDYREAVEGRVAELIEGYINRTKQNCPGIHSESSAIQSTIAIMPLRVSSLDKQYEVRLLKLQLTATLASLWAAGFPRAVVVGVSHNESVVAQESFHLLKDHLAIRSIELQYVNVSDT